MSVNSPESHPSGRGPGERPPSVVCLEALQLVPSAGQASRGVLVRVSVDEGTVRARATPAAGQVLIIAGVLDDHVVRAAVVVTEVFPGGFAFRFAAMPPESRARLARFVYRRVERPAPQPRKPARIRSAANGEPSRRKTFSWTASLKDTDRHRTPSSRWLERFHLDPSHVIAPRTR